MGTKEIIDLEDEDWLPDGEREEYEQSEVTIEELETGVCASLIHLLDRVESYPPLIDAENEAEQVYAELRRAIASWRYLFMRLVSKSADVFKALVNYGGVHFLGFGYIIESIARDALAQLSASVKSLRGR